MASPNLRLQNGVLAVSTFPLTILQVKTRLSADLASGSGTLTVENISGFAINQILLLGDFGDESSEIIKTSASTAPTGNTVTLASNTLFDHALDCKVTVIGYDQAEFSRATTLTGSKSVLSTASINANAKETGYNDLVNSTGYAFARFKNSITSVFSGYSDAVPYTGNPVNSVEAIITKAVKDCGNELNDDFCNELDLIRDVQEAQTVVSSERDWSFELYKDTSSIVTINGETVYDLSGLSMKYPDETQSLLSVRLGNVPLDTVDYSQIEDAQATSSSDTLAADATVAATSVTLNDTSSFDATGTILLRSNGFVAYTANNTTTNVLSGIDASAITVLVPAGATVWQDIEIGQPNFASVIDGNMNLDIPPDTVNSGIPLKFRFLRQLPALTSFSSVTLVPFYSAMSYYVSSCIERRKRNLDESDRFQTQFANQVGLQVARWKLVLKRAQKAYVFANTARLEEDEDNVTWWT